MLYRNDVAALTDVDWLTEPEVWELRSVRLDEDAKTLPALARTVIDFYGWRIHPRRRVCTADELVITDRLGQLVHAMHPLGWIETREAPDSCTGTSSARGLRRRGPTSTRSGFAAGRPRTPQRLRPCAPPHRTTGTADHPLSGKTADLAAAGSGCHHIHRSGSPRFPVGTGNRENVSR